jgi:hypothetical protein
MVLGGNEKPRKSDPTDSDQRSTRAGMSGAFARRLLPPGLAQAGSRSNCRSPATFPHAISAERRPATTSRGWCTTKTRDNPRHSPCYERGPSAGNTKDRCCGGIISPHGRREA